MFEAYIYEGLTEKERINKEAITFEMYDYMVLLLKTKNIDLAKKTYMEIESIPDTPGNHYWKRKAKLFTIGYFK